MLGAECTVAPPILAILRTLTMGITADGIEDPWPKPPSVRLESAAMRSVILRPIAWGGSPGRQPWAAKEW